MCKNIVVISRNILRFDFYKRNNLSNFLESNQLYSIQSSFVTLIKLNKFEASY